MIPCKVIGSSSDDSNEIVDNFKNSESDNFLIKPIAYEEL